MDLRAIKTDRLYIKVAEKLSAFVSDGTLKAGDRFPSERELAEQMGVSRPTIREAMIAMELAGIIDIKTGSGIYVSTRRKRLDDMDKGVGPFEILEIRCFLESEACALAAVRINDDQISALKQAIKDMEEEEKKPDASEQADWRFHKIIATASQNSAILHVIDWLWTLRNQSLLSVAFLEKLRKQGVQPSIAEHRCILQALINRDADAAREAMRTHIENATASAASYFENQENVDK